MSTFVLEFLQFLVTYPNLIQAVMDAVKGGQTEAQLLASIKTEMVAASDAVVEAELGPRPK